MFSFIEFVFGCSLLSHTGRTETIYHVSSVAKVRRNLENGVLWNYLKIDILTS